MEELLAMGQELPEYSLSLSTRATEQWRIVDGAYRREEVSEEERKGYVQMLTERTQKIFTLGHEVAERFVEIGWQLKAIDEQRLYYYACIKSQSFEDIYDFAYKVFRFGKTTTFNLIRIVEIFGERGGPGLKKEYAEYSYSQLVELSRLKYGQEREYFTPDATVAEMRELRAGLNKYYWELDRAAGDWKRMLQQVRELEGKAAAEKASEKKEKKEEKPSGLLQMLSEADGGQSVEATVAETVFVPQTDEPVSDAGAIPRGNIMRGKLGFKNKHEREEWLLHLFDSHPEPYLDIPELRVKIYRYDFENGASLIIVGGTWSGNFDILMPDEPDVAWSMRRYTRSQVIEWMTQHAKEI